VVASVRSRRWLRARARALPVVVALAAVVLSALGLKSLVAGRAPASVVAAPPSGRALPSWALAVDFARAYLSWDVADPGTHLRALSRFVGGQASIAEELPARGSQRVLWAQAVQSRPDGPSRQVVVVEAETDHGLVYLAVPVAYGNHGWSVAGWPAVVGEPAIVVGDPSQENGQAVADASLREVVSRALGNYLKGDAADLQADLDPAAVVSLPPHPLSGLRVDSVVWQAPGTVAVDVHASDALGVTDALRYELDVVRRDRWYVRAIHTDPRR
jgi:hypothetical protein